MTRPAQWPALGDQTGDRPAINNLLNTQLRHIEDQHGRWAVY